MSVVEIIALAGGADELAALCGVSPITVRYWKMQNEIPRRHALTLLRELEITRADLTDVMPECVA